MQQVAIFNLITHEIVEYEAPDKELNIYPYENTNWLNYVSRFKFKIPEVIVTTADGDSTCNNCGQKYVGYQKKCVKPRYGYETSFWNSSVTIGNKLIGEKVQGDGVVTKTGLYPCNNSCTWSKRDEFYSQKNAFDELTTVIGKMCNSYISTNITMSDGDAEKYGLIQQIDALRSENECIKSALREVASRLNAGGSGLMGNFNF